MEKTMISKILLLVIIIALITFLTRVLPFIFSKSKKLTEVIPYLENNIPPMIMLLLVIYCLKDISWIKIPYGLSEIVSIIIVILLHVWKRNILLSIIGGTSCYIIFNQFLFKC
jgi:branched-subunit amino acid transport protein AzlD